MDNRIIIDKNANKLTIDIKAYCNQQQQLLLVWILLFSFCGLAIIAQFFQDYDEGSKVFLEFI